MHYSNTCSLDRVNNQPGLHLVKHVGQQRKRDLVRPCSRPLRAGSSAAARRPVPQSWGRPCRPGPESEHTPKVCATTPGPVFLLRSRPSGYSSIWEMGDEWEMINARRRPHPLEHAKAHYPSVGSFQVNALPRSSPGRHLDALGDRVDHNSPSIGRLLNCGKASPSGDGGRGLGNGGVHRPRATTSFSHTPCRYSTIRISMAIVTRV